MTTLIKFKSWMGKTSYLSTQNINNTHELDWNWNVLSKNAPMIIIRSLPTKPWNYKAISERADFCSAIEMVKQYPDKDWNFEHLSSNQYITIDILLATADKPWNMDVVSSNKNLITLEDAIQYRDMFKWDWTYFTTYDTFRFMKKYPELNWDWKAFSLKGDYTIHDVLENPTLPWDWSSVSLRPDITWAILENNRTLPWDWAVLSAHPIVTFKHIMTVNKLWSWWEFSMNPNLTANIIRANPLKPWCFRHISHNFHLIDSDGGNILLDFPKEDWDWEYISTFVPYTFITDHVDKLPFSTDSILSGTEIDWNFVSMMATKMNWNWTSIVQHKDLTTEAVIMLLPHFLTNDYVMDWLFEKREDDVDLIEISVAMQRIGRRVSLEGSEVLSCWTWNHVLKYPNKDWDWGSLSCSKKVTMDIIEKHMNLPWDWEMVSENPNLTWQFILAHPTLEWDMYSYEYRRAMREKVEYDMERARAMSRNEMVKEEVIAKAMEPTRFEKYLEIYNYDMAGDEYI